MQFNREVAQSFLATLEQIHLVAIATNGIAIHGRCFNTDCESALNWAQDMNRQNFGIYWTVNIVRPGLNKKSGKSDVTHARFVHVDIDPPKSGAAFDKPATIAALNGLKIPPSFIVDSGNGLNALWRLDEPCANLQAIENINMQVRSYFDADACQNIDRVLRLPGSVNWPNAAKVSRGLKPVMSSIASDDDGVCYLPLDISANFPPCNIVATEIKDISLPALIQKKSCNDIGLELSDSLRDEIENPPNNDRSAEGLRVARLLAERGYKDSDIAGILINPENGISGHFLDQPNPKRAIQRAISLVRADCPEGDGPDPTTRYFDIEQIIANGKKREKPAHVEPEPSVKFTVSKGEPNWIRGLDGPLRRYIEHVLSHAPSPQPFLTLGSALAMYGAIAGRRYASPSDLRTNLYCIGIADSGGGKDFVLKSATNAMIESGLQEKLGGSKIASGAALITSLKKSPNIMYPLDEVGMLISAAADRRKSPKYLLEIMDNMTEMYSMSDSIFLGTDYANQEDRPRESIVQPCLSVFGVTTPAIFWGALSSSNVTDGSLARMIIFESEDNYPDPQEPSRISWPNDIIQHMQSIGAGVEGHNCFPLGEHSSSIAKPYQVPYADDSAITYSKELRAFQTSLLRKNEGTTVTGIIGRLAENATKMALVRAITENPQRPRITRDHLEWGHLISGISVDTLLKAVRERVSDNQHEDNLKKLMRVIGGAGPGGITHENLAKQSAWLGNRRNLNDAIDFLCEAGNVRVEEIKRDGGGRARRVYYDIS